MTAALALGLTAALAWAVLLLARGFFWLARDDDRDAANLPTLTIWPSVACVVPARDEAASIGATVASLLAQDYPGEFRLVVVDDRSTDGTGEVARAAAAGDNRLIVTTGTSRPVGWTGKLWALQQGLEKVQLAPKATEAGLVPAPEFLLFTDADISHAPDSLRLLVTRARADGRVMVSLMARLRCDSTAERWLVPGFIFFFQMLYPFKWSNDPGARTAAAAGGCVLLDHAAFLRAGGLAPIRSRIIDDCALAAQMKRQGPIWLGLTERVTSLRPYPGIGALRTMVARTAYAQLGYNPLVLLGMMLALALVFMVPPGLVIFGHGAARWLGLAAWAAMALAFTPTLQRFGLSGLRGLALPGIALTYMMFTLDSAWAEWRGRGGMWKGEAAPRVSRARTTKVRATGVRGPQ